MNMVSCRLQLVLQLDDADMIQPTRAFDGTISQVQHQFNHRLITKD